MTLSGTTPRRKLTEEITYAIQFELARFFREKGNVGQGLHYVVMNYRFVICLTLAGQYTDLLPGVTRVYVNKCSHEMVLTLHVSKYSTKRGNCVKIWFQLYTFLSFQKKKKPTTEQQPVYHITWDMKMGCTSDSDYKLFTVLK